MATKDLHQEHWRYVRHLLLRLGVAGSDVSDVNQEVWVTVHHRQHTYDPQIHRSWRAWITGIARRCAANYRRARRRNEGEALPETLSAPGLNAEEAAILQSFIAAIANEDQREAVLLQAMGLTVEEIAAVQGITPEGVEKRLRMARNRLKEERKLGAFLGLGTWEALLEALRPKEPIAEEVEDQDWQKIADAIRQEGTPADDGPTEGSTTTSAQLVTETSAQLVTTASAQLVLSKGKLGALLLAAFLGGAAAGAFAMVGWEAHKTPKPSYPIEATVAVAPSSTTLSDVTLASATAMSGGRPQRTPLASATTSTVPASSAAAARSRRVLAQMSRALEQRRFAQVLTLAGEHERSFGALDRGEREILRAQAARGATAAP